MHVACFCVQKIMVAAIRIFWEETSKGDCFYYSVHIDISFRSLDRPLLNMDNAVNLVGMVYCHYHRSKRCSDYTNDNYLHQTWRER